MESLKNKWNNLSLRYFFLLSVLLTLSIVVLLSALVIGGCLFLRHRLLPDSNAVYLTLEETLSDGSRVTQTHLFEYGKDLHSLPGGLFTEDGVTASDETLSTRYSIEKIENSFEGLSPKRKLAYQAAGATMVAAPAIFAFAGTILCSVYFYRRKLKRPLELLVNATNEIMNQNLDFTITYDCHDEMGKLCHSFEDMRQALYKNNREMWQMLEERRLLQASVAHDLRNPIAIIIGYTEYLDTGLASHKISPEKNRHIVQNLNEAARRLEKYTESVRLLSRAEEIQVELRSVSAPSLAESISEDLSLLAEQSEIVLVATNKLPDREISVDSALLYRVLENIISNALRYARQEIRLEFTLTDHCLGVTVTDDGPGFSPQMFKQKERTICYESDEQHRGIGLAISRLLCQKHGGTLELSNRETGACVKVFLSV